MYSRKNKKFLFLTAFLGYQHSLKRNSFSSSNLSNLPFKPIKSYYDLHLLRTQLLILKENKQKSGIYCIFNNLNGKFYIGSAITNRINTRFRNHCIHGTGSSLLKKSINKYGLENFSFFILEYYPGFVHKENMKKAHLNLLSRETYYINLLNPYYNILTSGFSSLGYKHSEETINKMKMNYSETRKLKIGNLNKNKSLSNETKSLLSKKIKLRYIETNYKEFLSKRFSKPIILYKKDGIFDSEYNSIQEFCKKFKCCTKTVNKCLKSNTLFRDLGYLKYKTK